MLKVLILVCNNMCESHPLVSHYLRYYFSVHDVNLHITLNSYALHVYLNLRLSSLRFEILKFHINDFVVNKIYNMSFRLWYCIYQMLSSWRVSMAKLLTKHLFVSWNVNSCHWIKAGCQLEKGWIILSFWFMCNHCSLMNMLADWIRYDNGIWCDNHNL